MNIKSLLFGLAVGDALGVPVEFKPRTYLKEHPVTGMQGYGTHHQPPGTWSDDSALAFCLAEQLAEGFDLEALGRKFVKWRTKGYWTPHGQVFDVGNTTDEAIYWLAKGISPEDAGSSEESSNGNGSLMRIAPLVFYLMDKSRIKQFKITKHVSSITHGHTRSIMACHYYLEFARNLIMEGDKWEAFHKTKSAIIVDWGMINLPFQEADLFNRLLMGHITTVTEDQIQSSGYVLHTLEASIWCLLTTDNYRGAVLKAVNLGHDTDTTGAVTGALAGLLYGYEAIPQEWIETLARRKDIEDLAGRMQQSDVYERVLG